MADNSITKTTAVPTQPVAAQPTVPTAIFAGNDAKRMSFDGQLPPLLANLSQSPTSLGLTSGLIGGGVTYNPDRRDSLKHLVHLQDFGTD